MIVVAGTIPSRCADAIAEITGWGRLLVGTVLLAGATSLPELTVDISAVKLGLFDLAVGDLLGSSLMNRLMPDDPRRRREFAENPRHEHM